MRITNSEQHIQELETALNTLKVQIIGELQRFKIYSFSMMKARNIDEKTATTIINLKSAEMRGKMAERYKALEDTFCILTNTKLKHETTPEDRILELTAEISAQEAILNRAIQDKWEFVSPQILKRKLGLWRDILESFQTVETLSDNQQTLSLQ